MRDEAAVLAELGIRLQSLPDLELPEKSTRQKFENLKVGIESGHNVTDFDYIIFKNTKRLVESTLKSIKEAIGNTDASRD